MTIFSFMEKKLIELGDGAKEGGVTDSFPLIKGRKHPNRYCNKESVGDGLSGRL